MTSIASTGSRTVPRPASRAGHDAGPLSLHRPTIARRTSLAAMALLAAALVAGCQSTGGESAAVPAQPQVVVEEQFCPGFDIFEGGSAARSGDGRGLRHQLAIRNTARECFTHADGSRTVNVGVEVLALLGPAGSPGTFSAPLRIAVKRGDTVIDTRTRQVSVAIPSGSAQNITSVVEEGLRLPEDTAGVLIEVGLGSSPARARR